MSKREKDKDGKVARKEQQLYYIPISIYISR